MVLYIYSTLNIANFKYDTAIFFKPASDYKQIKLKNE